MKRLAFLAVLMAGPVLAEAPAQLDGYRMEEYRAPTPTALDGAKTIDTATAYDLWKGGTAEFIDVLPNPPKPKDLPEGTVWNEKRRDSIPGATWLANVGYGALADVTEAYYKEGLAAATHDDLTHPIVIFCKRDCWMSWNAAKRALSYGYEMVYWFPDGTDGWGEAAHPTVRVFAEPEPQ